MSIRIQINSGFAEIWDAVLEENGWVIIEQPDHSWALYDNGEHQISNPDDPPFKIYPNHELGDAIKQAQKWT